MSTEDKKTTLKIEKITPKPPKHEAVLVTEENYVEIAEWLNGSVVREQVDRAEPTYEFRFADRLTSYGCLKTITVTAGTYIVKPARERNQLQDNPFALGAKAYDKFFKKAR